MQLAARCWNWCSSGARRSGNVGVACAGSQRNVRLAAAIETIGANCVQFFYLIWFFDVDQTQIR